MRIDFFCCNCLTQRELDVHGKCEVCGSRQTYYYPADVEPVYLPVRRGLGVVTNSAVSVGLVLLAITATYVLVTVVAALTEYLP